MGYSPRYARQIAEVACRDIHVGRLNEEDEVCHDDNHLRTDDQRHAPAAVIGKKGREECGYSANVVRWDRHELRIGGIGPHIPNNLRHRELKGVVWHRVRPVDNTLHPDLPVDDEAEERIPGMGPTTLIFGEFCNPARRGLRVGAILDSEPHRARVIFRIEPGSR